MVRSAQFICFALLKQSIIFVAVLAIMRGTFTTGTTTTTTTAAKSEFVLFLEVVFGLFILVVFLFVFEVDLGLVLLFGLLFEVFLCRVDLDLDIHSTRLTCQAFS